MTNASAIETRERVGGTGGEAKPPATSIERARRALGRAGFLVALTALVAGGFLFAMGAPGPASYVFRLAVGVLIALPVRNIIALLLEESASRDWLFVSLAAAALVMLVFAVAL